MNLRAIAHEDLKEILNDTDTGGVDITITSPALAEFDFKAFSNDIHAAFDPNTGQTVTGRQCSVAVLISELITAGFYNNTNREDDIRGVVDKTSKPWLVTATDVNGIQGTFKVVETFPDNGAGLMPMLLEVYETL